MPASMPVPLTECVPCVRRLRLGTAWNAWIRAAVGPGETLELVPSASLRRSDAGNTRLLLDLAHEAFLEVSSCVDAARRHLGRTPARLVIEDEQLAAARHVRDDALADEGVDEVAALSPDLGVRAHGNPAAQNRPVFTDVLPRSPAAACRLELDVVADRVLADADNADELDLDPGLLHAPRGSAVSSTVSPSSIPPPGMTELNSGSPGKSKTSSSSSPVSGCSRVT